ENKEEILTSVLKNYAVKKPRLKESFKIIKNKLEINEINLADRKALEKEHEKNFGSTICDSHLIERGFVDGHTNYEYEWYLHIDYTQKKKEYIELFINRVRIAAVSLSMLVKDYAGRSQFMDSLLIDPNELIEEMSNENYRKLLGEILADSDKRIQSIMNKDISAEEGPLNHHYISHLYGGVSERELISYALKASVGVDDYAIIAMDQKIDQLLEILADKGSNKEMELLLALGYLLDFYAINFELNQTSCTVG
ncbi:MAG: hypothetical protein L0L39_06600, partial [Atopostipes suicloacalis]|nr:hypothetical protein [Atopostipes suicloacalis]